ncbi:MAG: 2-isopropylmalate synthase [Deltaproteobacteria bacterium GWC2_56_8]|nr:MAG: 2-isopropylmalate synthase [Deltaproteobacteria bacterium GWB2_55_19]OGP35889.1 MAG: 2-isopropylmalate synthase [Deltaproteobacteria bacterium GWC2_56_8]HAO93476.1 2-isopropylmalate synthase [Deltaproteobacteria bacterium]
MKNVDTRIRIFDTTLRDGEQSPGASMNVEEKLIVARQLAKLGVDVIEAGFAFSSPGDFEAVRRIAHEVEGPVMCSLARCKHEDIDAAWGALKGSSKPRIHTFISTSDIHLLHQFKLSREEALRRAVEMVERARGYLDDVEFSAMDASRTEPEYLYEMIEAVINAGASTINIPDTVGYALPETFGALIKGIKENVHNIGKAIISVHCHNDLGLAVANSLSAAINGARQIECTINGIGERAGNCSLEEIVMIFKTRKDLLGLDTGITTEQLYPASRLVSSITGIMVQPNKAIVGDNAFAHESGIHQDGLLKDKSTYEIIRPESIGLSRSTLVLGKHSGRHAFKARLADLGYDIAGENLDKAFERFKALADKKKEVFDEDIEAIVQDEVLRLDLPERYKLLRLYVQGGTDAQPNAEVTVEVDGKAITAKGAGDGPVDAAYNTIAGIVKTRSRLLKYSVNAITGGTDAQGEVSVRLEEDGNIVLGQGSHTDIIVASAKAYINALNRLEYKKKDKKEMLVL